jgi:putative membrane protein insertion efficiency factor
MSEGELSWAQRIALGSIRVYQLTVSPVLGPACRFEPSCSRYAAEALARHGIVNGSRLAVARLLRCHPLGSSGFDPVP